jgi:hypothetical protein
LLFFLVLFASRATPAQPVPTLRSVTPDVVQRGHTANLTLTGDHIADASQVLIAGHSGLFATIHHPTPATKPSNDLTIDITASPDAPPGPRQLRLVTPNGVTRPLILLVDDLAPIVEREPNNSPGEAQPVTLPAIITGKIQADLDIDCFAIDATKGQRLIFDVHAFRAGSKLDASLTLLDTAGRRVAHDEDTNGLDPLVDYTVPATGRYTLRIQDLQYKGGPDFTYKIRGGQIPYVDAVFPLGGQRGQQVSVELRGRNLAGMKKMSMALDPGDLAPTRDLAAPTPAGLANPIPFAVSDLPDMTEDAATTSSAPLTPPLVINGCIAKANQTDTFKFKSPAAGPLVLQVVAARFGSRLDALLTLMDEKSAILARNDDTAAPAATDPRIQFNAEKDKLYQVSVRDLTDHGGDAYGYRLSIAPPKAPRPDFAVTLHATEPLRLNRGGRTLVRAEVTRTGGFAGDVTVSLWPLPPGVTCRPLRTSATQPSSGVFTLAAANDAPTGFHPLSVVATGAIGDEVVTKTASSDPAIKVVPQAYLTIHDAAPIAVARIGPPSMETDPKARAAKIAALEKTLNTSTPQLAEAQAKWEKTFDPARAWEIADVIEARASSSIPLQVQPDGSILAKDRVPSVDKYTVLAKVAQGSIRAIRLEAIATSDTIGPGRAPNGNFVLTAFRAAALPAGSRDPGAGKPIEFASATADFNQAGFDVADTLAPGKPDGGWAIVPETGKTHVATYRLKSPALPGGDTTLAFTLDHSSKFTQHIIGRFRLLVTSAGKPDDSMRIPSALLAVLKTTADKRTKEQSDSLAAFYRTIAPELLKTRQELAALKTSGAPFPPVVSVGGAAKLDVLLDRPEGFAGDVSLSFEGYSTGLDDKTKEPQPFTKNFDFTPVTLKPAQSPAAVLEFRPKPTAEKGTREAVLRAETTVNGAKYITYSAPFPITVK